MRIAVTGTPGTGKTSATEQLPDEIGGERVEVIHLNEHVETDGLSAGVDEARDSLVADIGGIAEWLDARETAGNAETDDDGRPEDGDDAADSQSALVVESHLSHLLPADRAVVLRCRPDELKRRLRERGVGETKATENAESEALDVILAEAVARHSSENVYEIDTTDLTPAAVGEIIASVLVGERAPSAGTVSFLGYFE